MNSQSVTEDLAGELPIDVVFRAIPDRAGLDVTLQTPAGPLRFEPVTLRDGQVWFIPKPRVFLCYLEQAPGVESIAEFDDPDIDARFKAVQSAIGRADAAENGIDPETGKAFMGLIFDRCRIMLARNYTLTFEEFRDLVHFTDGPDELALAFTALSQGRSRPAATDALAQSMGG